MTASHARRKRRLLGQTTLTPPNAEPFRLAGQGLILRGIVRAMGDIVRREMGAAIAAVLTDKQPGQSDRQTAEKALADGLGIQDRVLRARALRAAWRAALSKLGEDLVPKDYADGLILALERLDSGRTDDLGLLTPARPIRPPASPRDDQ